MAVLTDGRQTYVPPARIPIFKPVVAARIAAALGAFHEAEPIYVELGHTGYPGYASLQHRHGVDRVPDGGP